MFLILERKINDKILSYNLFWYNTKLITLQPEHMKFDKRHIRKFLKNCSHLLLWA